MGAHFDTSLKLGILGGGQLGKMLIQSAMNLGLHVKVLDNDEHAPCSTYCDEFVRGPLTDRETVLAFGSRVDVLTIEIENVNVDALEELEARGIAVHPQSHVIRTIQDKGLQKEFLRRHGIPTAEFSLIAGREELRDAGVIFPAVQKLRTAGYDGRGVHKITRREDLDRAFDAPSILERLVPFDKEISVIVARRSSGEVKSYPAVEMVIHPGANLVDFLLSPADVPAPIEARAEEIARRVAEALGIVGLAAVEMFVERDGTVLVNEIAPRPHNSGHQTIEASVTSQYEQHLRAILDLPLGSTATKSPSVMVNILGAEGYEGPARYEGIAEILALEGTTVHLYGKKITKPFRKMGHVTILDNDPEGAMRKARYVQQHLKVIA
jgi:5-(carboxyamino)imidazole ribonucleotide synthase